MHDQRLSAESVRVRLPDAVVKASRKHARRFSVISFCGVGLIPSALAATIIYLPDITSAELIVGALVCQSLLFAILFLPRSHRLIDRLRSFQIQCPRCAERIDLGDPWICKSCVAPHGVGILGALNPSPPTLGCDRAHCDAQPNSTIQCPHCDALLEFRSLPDEPACLGAEAQRIAKFIH